MVYHKPVLAAESIAALAIKPEGTYVDATFGGGGHSALILNTLGDKGRLIGFDQDEDASANVLEDERFTFVQHNFRYLKRFLKLHGFRKVDGILADLGVSSHQIDEKERGFSHRFESQLDMRMNQKGKQDATDILNSYTANQLQAIFSQYGELRNARTLAQQIVQHRINRPIHTVSDLLNIMEPLIRGQRQRYLSQVFQALRIEVNDEIDALHDFLMQALEVLKPGGRLVVISYHSIEDRIVKNFLRSGSIDGTIEKDFYGNIFRPFTRITKKPIVPNETELKENPRSRSARLRVGEKLEKEVKGEK